LPPEPLPRLREKSRSEMKALRNIFFILCVLSLCSKVTLHTYRHFLSAAVAAAAH
jgi:hypothetical protein